MIKLKHLSVVFGFCALLLHASSNADGFIKKEVYSYKDKSGNIVFTDRLPTKKQAYKTQTIEAANSTGDSQSNYSNSTSQSHYNSNNHSKNYSNNAINSQQTVRVIVEEGNVSKKSIYKKKLSLKRCKSYKKKFTYYSDKMNSGYKNSEYKKLEYNRKKYKNLLFNNCETKTFND